MIRLRELTVLGFGDISRPDAPVAFETERVNLLVGDNESGKTTIAEALFAALYGVEHDRRKAGSILPHAQIWGQGGKPFAVRLLLDAERPLEVRWDFHERRLSVSEADTRRDRTDDFRVGSREYDIGGKLLGLSAEEFRKICYVAQERVSDAEELAGVAAVVQRMAGSRKGDTTTAQAVAVLEGALRDYPGRTAKSGRIQIGNEIKRIEEQLAELDMQIAGIEGERLRLRDQEDCFQLLAAEEARLGAAIDDAAFQERLARRREMGESFTRVGKLREQLRQEREHLEELSPLAAFPAGRAAALREARTRRERAGEEDAGEARRLAQEVQPRRDRAEHDLQKLDRLALANDGDVSEATKLLALAEETETQLRKVEQAVVQAERDVAAEGITLDKRDALARKLAPLDDEQRAAIMRAEAEELRLQSETAAARAAVNGVRGELEEIGRARARQRHTANLVVTVSIAAAIACAILGVVSSGETVRTVWFALVALGPVGGAVGWALRATAAGLRADEHARATHELQEADDRLRRRSAQLRELTDTARQAAEATGYADAAALRAALRSFETMDRRCADLVHRRARGEELRLGLDELAQRVFAMEQRFGREPDGETPAPRLKRLRQALRGSLAAQATLRDAEAAVKAVDTRRAELARERREQEGAVRAVLEAAGIDAADIDAGAQQFEENVRKHELYRRLAAETVPDLERRCAEAERDCGDAEARARLDARIEQDLRAHPGWAGIEAPEPSARYSEHHSALVVEQREVVRQREQAGEVVRGIQAQCSTRLPELEEERALRQEWLGRALRHQETVGKALDEMRAVAEDVHRNWAEGLNRAANEILPSLAPTLCALKFDPELSFSVMRAGRDQSVSQDDAHRLLSAGQRDQLYLAVRLGIAAFAGGDEPLPLILDDPFVNFDDRRSAAAFRFLAESSAGRQQVVVFTCHRRRFEWIREADPEWFEKHVAWRDVG